MVDVAEFVESVCRVAEGGTAFDPEVVAQLMGRRRRDDPLSELTPREREVLSLMAEGLSNSAIAKKLWLTVGAAGIVAVAVGGSHTCAITEAQQLKCWGENFSGQLGDGSSTNSSTPVDVMGF